MITDITLGQYIPGNSVLHRLDPRTKIILTFAYIAMVFAVNSLVGYVFTGIFLFILIRLSHIPLKFVMKSLKPIYIFIVFTALLNLFMTGGEYIFSWGILHISREGAYTAAVMALRLIFLVAGSSLLTYTTSPIVLTDGIEALLKPLERFKFPAHELAMMMTIALRFIPTIIEETDKIMKAQTARGADFDTGGLIKKAKAMVPLLIPLFISSFRRADELALAMECRGYHGGEGRTKLKELKLSGLDAAAYAIFTLLAAVCVFAGKADFGRLFDFLR